MEYSGGVEDFKPTLAQFRRYLVDNGFRQTTIDVIEKAGKYLEFAQTHNPTPDILEKFRATLHGRKLARQTINNYCIAIKSFHGMLGDKVSFPFLKISDTIPYYFGQDRRDLRSLRSVVI